MIHLLYDNTLFLDIERNSKAIITEDFKGIDLVNKDGNIFINIETHPQVQKILETCEKEEEKKEVLESVTKQVFMLLCNRLSGMELDKEGVPTKIPHNMFNLEAALYSLKKEEDIPVKVDSEGNVTKVEN